MICRSCRLRAFVRYPARPFSISRPVLSAPSQAPEPVATATATPAGPQAVAPVAATALKPSPASPPRSSCTAGTVLPGLNYFKDRQDVIALPDEEYPEWLWTLLDPVQNVDDGPNFGDEYSKSKKERKRAVKLRQDFENKMRAEGNLVALLPKVPLHQQSINLPDGGSGTVEEAIAASEARKTLERALAKDTSKRIMHQNYLKTI